MKKNWINALIMSCIMLLVGFGLCACKENTKYTLFIYVDNEIFQTVELEESEIETYTLPTIDMKKDDLYYFSGWTGDIKDNKLKINEFSKSLTVSGTYKPIFSVSENGELSVDENDITKSFKELIIPSNINDINVLSIGNYEFSNFNNLKTIVLPTTLQSIGSDAFNYCWGLMEIINLSNMNIEIGSHENGGVGFHAYFISNDINDRLVYQNIDGTLYVEDNDHLIAIGVEDRNTKEIIINENTDSISDFAFANCKNVEKIYFNPTACYGLPTTTHATCGIGRDSKNVTVYIGANVKSIPDRLFMNTWSDDFYGNYYGATHIKNVIFSEGSQCESIGDYAFDDCIYLESIIIPHNIKYIGIDAYMGCVNVTEINYKATNCTNISTNSFLYSNSGDQRQLQVNIGKGVQHIPANIFNKDDISKVVFEEGSICETIDDYAFDNSSITYIILPKSIKTIGSYALGDICIEIYYLGNEIEWEEVEKTAADYEDITIYYYIEDESNLPQDNGNYWHYDIDRKTPIIWQGIE